MSELITFQYRKTTLPLRLKGESELKNGRSLEITMTEAVALTLQGYNVTLTFQAYNVSLTLQGYKVGLTI